MKILLTFSVLTLMSFTTEAQTNSSRTITLEPILETKQKPRSSRKRRVFQLTLETETMTVRDRNNDITGSTTYYQAEPQLNITDRFNARLGMAYFDRFAGGSYKGREDKNHDHIDNYYTKLDYRLSKFSENNILDVRLQARAYTTQDDVFKRAYASDGDYQFRAYFGRPLYGNWSINRFTSYIRYKNYFNNEYVSNYSRDYELRARISPTYRVYSGTDLGMTFTYNHFFKVNKLNDEEQVDIDLSARYQPNQYAFMVRLGIPYMRSEGGEGTLKRNEDAGKQFSYAFTMTAFL